MKRTAARWSLWLAAVVFAHIAATNAKVETSGTTGTNPSRKQMMWEVFKYADTPQREQYFEFAKSIVGIKESTDPPTNTEPLPR